MIRTVALAFSLVLASGPVLADSARLTGLPSALLAGDAAEGTQHVLPTPPIRSIQAGSTEIVLDQTRLADLQQPFGGKLRHAGDGSAAVTWLCYSLTVAGRAADVWFISDAEGGGLDAPVTLVASAFPAPPGSDCDDATGGLTSIDFSVPGLGATKEDLVSRFGEVAARDGLVAYINQTPGKDGVITMQSVNYLLQDGQIVGVAASEITAN